MKNLVFLLIVILFSCNSKKIIEKRSNTAINSSFVTQITISKILVDATKAIYKENSLKYNTPVYIHSLKVNFNDKVNSYDLIIDSIKAIWASDSSIIFKKIKVRNDSLYYDNVSIPFLKTYFEKDTINVRVVCKYLPHFNKLNQNIKLKCLSASYEIEKQQVRINKKFEDCN